MIYVTGDTHGEYDFFKLQFFAFQNRGLTKEDYVIVAGDFGGVWSKKSLKKDLDRYSRLPFTVLFVDGNHENFDLLNAYPVEVWNGGKVHKIREDILHLMRGQVFEIEGKRIFTFGGATSVDRALRQEGVSWWRQELPTFDDQEEGYKNLKKYGNRVDYVITHSCSQKTLRRLPLSDRPIKRRECLDNAFLTNFEAFLEYEHWYFGHYHVDYKVSEKQSALYHKVVPLGKTAAD